jgi:hypothetical protein
MKEKKEKYEIEDLVEKKLITRDEIIDLLRIDNDEDFVKELIKLSKVHDWGKFIGERISNKLNLISPDELVFDKHKYLEFEKFLLCVSQQHINLDKNEVINLSKQLPQILSNMKSDKKIIKSFNPNKKKETQLEKITKQVLNSYKKKKNNLLN